MKNYFVCTLDKGAVATFCKIRSTGCETRLHFMYDHLGSTRWAAEARERLPLAWMDVSKFPTPPCNSAMVYRWALRICESSFYRSFLDRYSVLFDVSEEYLSVALHKIIIDLIRDDVNLVGFSRNIAPESDNTYLVTEKALLALVRRDLDFVAVRRSWAGPLRHILSSATSAILGCFFPSRLEIDDNGSREWIIFEQAYSDRPENPEFMVFYEYLRRRDDVLYTHVHRGSWMSHFLGQEKKPMMSGSWRLIGRAVSKRKLMVSLMRFCQRALARSESLGVKRLVLELKLSEMYYIGLFRLFAPSFFLRVRADYCFDHPIITGVIESFGGRHIGYQHGNYYPPSADSFAFICFHAYGIWGLAFQTEAFSESWPVSIPYPIIGPFTVNCCEDGPVQGAVDSLTIGIVTTSVIDVECSGYSDYLEFLDASYAIASKLGATVLVKEKCYLPQTAEADGALQRKFGLTVRKIFSSANQVPTNFVVGVDFDVKAAGYVISCSDLVIVMHHSSVAWEALSCRKRVVVYTNGKIPHFFEETAPDLVVRTREELEERVDRLLEMPQADYECLISPLLEKWSKENDGHLAQTFWEEIFRLFDRRRVAP